jgi:hypothetical protein
MLKVALTPYPSHLTNIYSQIFRQFAVGTGRLSFQPILLSLSVHILLLVGLPFLLVIMPSSQEENALASSSVDQIVYYRFTRAQRPVRVPKLLPAGPVSTPVSGALSDLPPTRKLTSLSNISAVSKPRLPDNDHQTILQAQSAPDLRMKADLKLPNLIVLGSSAPKRPLAFHPNEIRPIEPVKIENLTDESAPRLKTATPTDKLATLLSASDRTAKLAVPIGAPPAPNLPFGGSKPTTDISAPEIGAGNSAPGLLVLGTEPADPSSLVALPPGNRMGEFSVTSGGTSVGSSGGNSNHISGIGSNNGNTDGNESAGNGSGKKGRGGSSSGGGFISLSGSDAGSESMGVISPAASEGMVFAVPKLTGLRHSGIVVTAGPIGGGGLGVYGALHCGKIYTVLLPMSGKNWTLQFCPTRLPEADNDTPARAGVVHIETPLLPPEVEARYDFKRFPLPLEKAHKLIILKGAIRADGSVENLKILEGLMPEMDQAALVAFRQWTFKPAMRLGKPVSLDILVGIPADLPATGQGMATKIEAKGTAGRESHKSN